MIKQESVMHDRDALHLFRLQEEHAHLLEIKKLLKNIHDERQSDKALGDDNVTESSITSLKKASQLFSSPKLSEIVGGIKRATESNMPWDGLKFLSTALSDLAVVKKFEENIKNFLDSELEKLIIDIEHLLNIIGEPISLYREIDKIKKAIEVLNKRIDEGLAICKCFESKIGLNPEQQTLDNLVEQIKKYKEEREKDVKAAYILLLLPVADDFKEEYLRDNKKMFCSTCIDYLGFYVNEKGNIAKQYELVNLMTTLIKNEIDAKHNPTQNKMNDKLTKLREKAKLGNLDRREIRDTYQNLLSIINNAYDKRAIIAISENLQTVTTLKIEEELHKIAMLELVARVGELEKKCSFMETVNSWVAARSKIYHAFDTKKGINKYKKVLNNQLIFNELHNKFKERLKELTSYKDTYFMDGFLKASALKYQPQSSLEILLNNLADPPANNCKPEIMRRLQLPVNEKKQLMEQEINNMKTKVTAGNSIDELLKFFEKNPVIALYISLNFKLIAEMLKFIEELDLDESKEEGKKFYKQHANTLKLIKEKRGEMAHSISHVDNTVIAECFKLISENGSEVIKELGALQPPTTIFTPAAATVAKPIANFTVAPQP